ncbi:MAG TPA: 30S ribosomal protein S20 [Thiomicrospira sp.]|nr:30S ribosomal protein S20 [Thiomicrospira sp.]
MANSAQATKRARQAEKSRVHNNSLRAAMRTTVKKVKTEIATGNKETANAAFRVAQSSLDGMARKGLVAKNKVARTKSRLNAKIKAL